MTCPFRALLVSAGQSLALFTQKETTNGHKFTRINLFIGSLIQDRFRVFSHPLTFFLSIRVYRCTSVVGYPMLQQLFRRKSVERILKESEKARMKSEHAAV